MGYDVVIRTPQVVFEQLVKMVEDSLNKVNAALELPADLSILFYYSTPVEFTTQVGSLPEDSKYPFVFVNSVKTEFVQSLPTGEVWDVPDIVIATKSDALWTREQRDELNFKPILNPILVGLSKALQISRYTEVMREGKATAHYFYGAENGNGYTAHSFNQAIDAWQISNLRLRITKQC